MLDGLNYIFNLAIFVIILAVVYGGYKIYENYYMDTVIETKEIVIPNYILVTDGKTIDTTYVYTFKK